MTAPYYIGIDLGTSSVKALLVDDSGRSLAQASRSYPILAPQHGWAEQDPQAWTQAALECLAEVVRLAQAPAGDIAGIGLSGQMHGCLPLDPGGKPLRPAIIWADRRSAAQVARIQTQIGSEKLRSWTGNPVAAGFSLPTWLWLSEHEPATTRNTAHLLLPKDYLRYRLTGEIGAEPSDAASTLLFDPVRMTWSQPLLEAFGIRAEILPPVGASHQVAGGLLPEIAAQTGLKAGTPLVFGGSDQACQALGRGVVDPGVVSSTIGTGGQLFAPIQTPRADPVLRLHLFPHVVPGRWHLQAATLAAGLSLKWLSERVFPGETFQALADLAAGAPPGAGGVFFLPHLAGERTPYMDPQARALFAGLSLEHGRAHMARAVMEGVVFALRQGLELMAEAGVRAERLVASGGAAAHPLWLQLQADIFGQALEVLPEVEAAALGAAMLAALGLESPDPGESDVGALLDRFVRPARERVTPQPEAVVFYERYYATFTRLYPALSGLYPDWPASEAPAHEIEANKA